MLGLLPLFSFSPLLPHLSVPPHLIFSSPIFYSFSFSSLLPLLLLTYLSYFLLPILVFPLLYFTILFVMHLVTYSWIVLHYLSSVSFIISSGLLFAQFSFNIKIELEILLVYRGDIYCRATALDCIILHRCPCYCVHPHKATTVFQTRFPQQKSSPWLKKKYLVFFLWPKCDIGLLLFVFEKQYHMKEK